MRNTTVGELSKVRHVQLKRDAVECALTFYMAATEDDTHNATECTPFLNAFQYHKIEGDKNATKQRRSHGRLHSMRNEDPVVGRGRKQSRMKE